MNTWLTRYSFADDKNRIAEIQAASLNTDAGAALEYGLVGSSEWWHNIEAQRLPVKNVDGIIIELHKGPMGDWPSILVQDSDGVRSWTAYSTFSTSDIGKRIRIEYVQIPPKKPPYPDYKIDLVLRMLTLI